MRLKSLIVGCFALVALVSAAQAQNRVYLQPGPGYGPPPGYAQPRGYGPPPGYGQRRGCLSSYGINDRLARSGWYPLANVGQTPDGRYLYMRVARGNQVMIATVDGCSGRIVQMQPGY